MKHIPNASINFGSPGDLMSTYERNKRISKKKLSILEDIIEPKVLNIFQPLDFLKAITISNKIHLKNTFYANEYQLS